MGLGVWGCPTAVRPHCVHPCLQHVAVRANKDPALASKHPPTSTTAQHTVPTHLPCVPDMFPGRTPCDAIRAWALSCVPWLAGRDQANEC